MNKQHISGRLLLSSLVFLLSFQAFTQNVHQSRTLQSISNELGRSYYQQKVHAERLADSLGIPKRVVRDGRVMELQQFRNGVPMYYVTFNRQGANTIKTSAVWPGGAAGLELTGQGQVLGIWDGGLVRTSHMELKDRVFPKDDAEELSDHATHVAGTMIGSGATASARGMAYQAQLYSYDFNNDLSEMAAAAARGLKVSNHSYGYQSGWYYDGEDWMWLGDPAVNKTEDYSFGFYDEVAREWDRVAHHAPHYMIVIAAGNSRLYGPSSPTQHLAWDGTGFTQSKEPRNLNCYPEGYDCISYAAVAKNVISVGAVGAGGDLASFSSWGPTDDGRIKPDIVAKGLGVYSSRAESDVSYQQNSGTSMASPMISGSIALLMDHYEKLYGPHFPLRTSTLKGLIIHTADRLSGSRAPDYRTGWGLMNTRAAAELMSEDARSGGNFHIRELVLKNNQTTTLKVVADGSGPLQATLAWIDPPARVSTPALNDRTLKLVNDLDIRIISPTQTTFSPWVLNPESPAATATTGDNIRDNVENIFIQNANPGDVYTIIISHKNSLAAADQEYSLILSGVKAKSSVNTLTFTVKDPLNQPVEGATIAPGITTDALGMAIIDRSVGNYSFTISKPGFEAQSVEISVDRHDLQVNVVLFPQNQVPQVKTLNLFAVPTSAGKVSGGGQFPAGISIDIMASASRGYELSNWTDDSGTIVSTQPVFNYTMTDKDAFLTANFTKLSLHPLTIRIEPSGSGIVSGEGSYYRGDEVDLTAITNEGFVFVNWTDEQGKIIDTYPRTSFSMPDSATTLIANFGFIPLWKLRVDIAPAGGGSVSGEGSYIAGDLVPMTAVPNTHYDFINWTDEEGIELSTSSEIMFNMPSFDLNLRANFRLKKYPLLITIAGQGEISVNGMEYTDSMMVEYGTLLNLVASAKPDWQFSGWEGELNSDKAEEVIIMQANTSLTASFSSQIFYTLTLLSDPPFAGNLDGTGQYHPWITTTISAIPERGFKFTGWSDLSGNIIDTSDLLLFQMPRENITMVANFSFIKDLSKIINPTVHLFPNPAVEYINVGSNKEILRVDITDLTGKIIYSELPGDNITRILTSRFIAGMYLIKVFVEDDVIVNKFQIIH